MAICFIENTTQCVQVTESYSLKHSYTHTHTQNRSFISSFAHVTIGHCDISWEVNWNNAKTNTESELQNNLPKFMYYLNARFFFIKFLFLSSFCFNTTKWLFSLNRLLFAIHFRTIVANSRWWTDFFLFAC